MEVDVVPEALRPPEVTAALRLVLRAAQAQIPLASKHVRPARMPCCGGGQAMRVLLHRVCRP